MDLLETILASDDLPELSPRISSLLQMLGQPDSARIDEVSRELAALQGFDQAVLTLINSPVYPLRREVRSLDEATMYMGMRNISFLLIALLTKGLLPRDSGRSAAFDRGSYWRHCVGTSMAAMTFGQLTGMGDRYKLFTYGIVHDIGTAILDACRPDLLDAINARMVGGEGFAEVERDYLGPATHGEIGFAVFRSWNVPGEVCEVVRYHHDPHIPDPPSADLDLLFVADAVATEYYQRLLGTTTVATADASVLARLGISRDDVDAMAADLVSAVDSEPTLLKLDELNVYANGG